VAAPFQIQRISIDAVSWTPVTAPFDCTSFIVKNCDPVNAVRLRTSSTDSTTEDLLGPAMEQAVAMGFHRYRFLAGSQPLWLQATAGTGPVVLKFLA